MQRRQRPALGPCLVLLALALAGFDCSAVKQRMYEGDGRDAWQQPDRVVAALDLRPGQQVVDLGSGSGYFTARLARAVAPGGRVYAVDVDAEMNARLEERLRDEGVENATVVLATEDDPGLPNAGMDCIFTSNTYHHLPDQAAYFERIQRSLAPGGRVAIVEYAPSRAGWFVRTFGHGTTREEIVSTMETAGYTLVASHDFLERQHFLIFEVAREAP